MVASTGRAAAHAYLRELGASEILEREALAAPSPRPLESERWGGAMDSVGGDTLAGLLRTMAFGTCVTVCGLAGGAELRTTVHPFILRGVSVLGIDSLRAPQARRRAVWARLARDLPLDTLERIIQVVPLRDVPALATEILAGRVRGRTVVAIHPT